MARDALADQLAGVGALAAACVAVGYLATGVSAALMPPELQGRPEIGPHEFWSVLASDPGAHLIFHLAWVVTGLAGLAVVPALSAWCWRASPGALLWSGAAAWLGFAVMARSHLQELAFDLKIIPDYPTASPAFQEAVHVVAGLALDVPLGALTYGAIGVWLAVVGLASGRAGLAPRGFAALGVLAGLVQLAGFAGYALAWRPLMVLSIGLGGGLLTPAWFGWAALRLRVRSTAG